MLSKKYRPSTFADLVGQEENVLILKHLVKNRDFKLPFLFSGPFGSGKTSASRVLAKAFLCEQLTADIEPCCKCQSCLDFQEDRNVNYSEIDAATNGDVESIRNLREQVSYSAINSSHKVTNIDEAHTISKAGYNALLKQLEDVQQHHIFMFCTNEPDKMLDTVRSRCQRIHVQNISVSQLEAHVKKVATLESIAIDDDAVSLLSQVTAPHIRDALNTMEFLSYRGKVTKADVEGYFQIGNKNLFLEFLISVQTNLQKAIECLDRMTEEFDIDVIYRRLIDTCLALEASRKGANYDVGYVDRELFAFALQQKQDYLAAASFLLKTEKPIDALYLKYLMLELHRILNNDSLPVYGNPVPQFFANNSPINPQPEVRAESSAPENVAPIIAEEPVQPLAQSGLTGEKTRSPKVPVIAKYHRPEKAPEAGVRGIKKTSADASALETKEDVLVNRKTKHLSTEEIRKRLAKLK